MTSRGSLFTLVLIAFCAGCSPTIDNRGFNAENVQFSEIKPGVHTKQQVQEMLGSPSTISSFDSSTWYYVSKKTSTTSFFTPDVLEQQVTVVSFDPSGVVCNIKTYKGDEAKKIKPIARKTETTGYETGVFREVFSNFGRLSSKKPK